MARKTSKGSKATEKKAGLNDCLCGCGVKVKGRFAQGHDARLHSVCLRIYRQEAPADSLPRTEATLAYLRTAPWMDRSMSRALGLGRR